MSIKIKKEFEEKIIGFNNSAVPLGKRKDLHKLLEIAKSSNRKEYLDLFETTIETDADKTQRFDDKSGNKHNNSKSDKT